MCDIKDKTRRKKVIGYKVVLIIGKNIYSPSTGLKYSVGMKIPNMKKKRKVATSNWTEMLNKNNRLYNSLMQGKTGVFKNLTDAKDFVNTTVSTKTLEIVEMTIGGEIYEGRLNKRYDTFIGTEILGIEPITK